MRRKVVGAHAETWFRPCSLSHAHGGRRRRGGMRVTTTSHCLSPSSERLSRPQRAHRSLHLQDPRGVEVEKVLSSISLRTELTTAVAVGDGGRSGSGNGRSLSLTLTRSDGRLPRRQHMRSTAGGRGGAHPSVRLLRRSLPALPGDRWRRSRTGCPVAGLASAPTASLVSAPAIRGLGARRRPRLRARQPRPWRPSPASPLRPPAPDSAPAAPSRLRPYPRPCPACARSSSRCRCLRAWDRRADSRLKIFRRRRRSSASASASASLSGGWSAAGSSSRGRHLSLSLSHTHSLSLFSRWRRRRGKVAQRQARAAASSSSPAAAEGGGKPHLVGDGRGGSRAS
uniref:Uncharacterized protein n=1 Tax=Oryza sativa subsp. japonica TaxID=39947 RepID=Q6ZAA4_ORYSJ|nr:hypothetical protein [Oryza sativa Japonica Group]BAD09818.1 hypothetical protein [Oryza sativa Japonica Group]